MTNEGRKHPQNTLRYATLRYAMWCSSVRCGVVLRLLLLYHISICIFNGSAPAPGSGANQALTPCASECDCDEEHE